MMKIIGACCGPEKTQINYVILRNNVLKLNYDEMMRISKFYDKVRSDLWGNIFLTFKKSYLAVVTKSRDFQQGRSLGKGTQLR